MAGMLVNMEIWTGYRRLGEALPTMHAKALHSLTLLLRGVPGDVSGVAVRVYQPDGTYYEAPAAMRPDGTGTVYLDRKAHV